MEQALTKPQVISTLARSPHGQLTDYLPDGSRAAREDADFFAHLVAWNHAKGEVRDARVALPVIALASARASASTTMHAENALAHLADLNPRELAKAVLPTRKVAPLGVAVVTPAFATTAGAPTRVLRRLVARYVLDLERDWNRFERVALQHRGVLHDLYAHFHVPRGLAAGTILFHGEKGKTKTPPPATSRFGALAGLHQMAPEDAAATIVRHRIPFLIARGALGKKATEPDTVLALIKAMSPTELATNMRWLEKAGVRTVPALRAALEEALGRAAEMPRPAATLKTTRAAEAVADDPALSGKLRALQEKQLDRLGGIDGDWLVLGDKSGSMTATIHVARQVAAVLTRMVKGRVHLVFFDTSPRYVDATGKTLEALAVLTAGIVAGGGTSIGCGLQYMLDAKVSVDGVAIVSDGGENTPPWFGHVYAKYCAALDVEPTVYLYQVAGESDALFEALAALCHVDVQRFDLRGQPVDYYSLPNLVQTMRVGRYQLLDEVLATPLRTLDEVLTRTKGVPVLARAPVAV